MTEQLLSCLRAHANHRGVVLVSQEALLKEVRADYEAIVAELDRLERAALVEILAPLPFLVLRLRKWSGHAEKSGQTKPSTYSYQKQLLNKQQIEESYRQGGDSEGQDPNLLREILDTLGETDGTSFAKAVELYSPHVIRTALNRVRRARNIRKNRTALFRHLLPRLAQREQESA